MKTLTKISLVSPILLLALILGGKTVFAAPTYVNSGINDSQQFGVASTPVDYTVDAGTGDDRVLYVQMWFRDRTADITSVTYAGEAMEAVDDQFTIGILHFQLFRLVNPASGSNTLSVDPGANGVGNAYAVMGFYVASGVDQTDPDDGYATTTGSSSNANEVTSLDVASEADDLVLVFHTLALLNGAATESGFTQRVEDSNMPMGGGMTIGDASGSATVSTSATWNNSASAHNYAVVGINLNAVNNEETFGYESIGANSASVENIAFYSSSTPASDGSITKISAYLTSTSGAHTAKCGVYDDTTNAFIAETNTNTIPAATGWVDFTFATPLDVTAGTDYLLACLSSNSSGSASGYYDDTVAGDGGQQASAYPAWPDPASPNANDNRYSIYATYTVGGGGGDPEPEPPARGVVRFFNNIMRVSNGFLRIGM